MDHGAVEVGWSSLGWFQEINEGLKAAGLDIGLVQDTGSFTWPHWLLWPGENPDPLQPLLIALEWISMVLFAQGDSSFLLRTMLEPSTCPEAEPRILLLVSPDSFTMILFCKDCVSVRYPSFNSTQMFLIYIISLQSHFWCFERSWEFALYQFPPSPLDFHAGLWEAERGVGGLTSYIWFPKICLIAIVWRRLAFIVEQFHDLQAMLEADWDLFRDEEATCRSRRAIAIPLVQLSRLTSGSDSHGPWYPDCIFLRMLEKKKVSKEVLQGLLFTK